MILTVIAMESYQLSCFFSAHVDNMKRAKNLDSGSFRKLNRLILLKNRRSFQAIILDFGDKYSFRSSQVSTFALKISDQLSTEIRFLFSVFILEVSQLLSNCSDNCRTSLSKKRTEQNSQDFFSLCTDNIQQIFVAPLRIHFLHL